MITRTRSRAPLLTLGWGTWAVMVAVLGLIFLVAGLTVLW